MTANTHTQGAGGNPLQGPSQDMRPPRRIIAMRSQAFRGARRG